jgi:hypothetical protein
VDDAVIREAMGEKKEKKTGYERNASGDYYFVTSTGGMESEPDVGAGGDDYRYNVGNYYTAEEVANNNARADNLMRQLRRFAAEHGGCLCPRFRNGEKALYVIRYDGALRAYDARVFWPTTWGALFTSKESCEAAIEAFRDELTWYFTEYDPMPEGWWDS